MMRAALTVAAYTATTLLIARPTLTKALATTSASIRAMTPNTDTTMPTLKGVVFDMDDTLVRSNLSIKSMYRSIFGTDPLKGCDILKEIEAIPNADEKARAYQIVDDAEEEGRKQMKLMPGCPELLAWLSAHDIPTALVTRNSRKTTDVFCQKLQALQSKTSGTSASASTSTTFAFERIITRDDREGEGETPIPPKPDPMAMTILARECFGVTSTDGGDFPEILMVGDSIANDVVFGKNAGVRTALLAPKDTASSSDDMSDNADADAMVVPDIRVETLTELPQKLWKAFEIAGPLGNTEEANRRPLHGSPPPKPESVLSKAVASGDLEAVRLLLEEGSPQSASSSSVLEADPENGNTALIWAAECGHAAIASLLLASVPPLLATLVENCNSASSFGEIGEIERDIERLKSFANHRGFLGATALNRAARRGHTDVLKMLLSPLENAALCEFEFDFDLDIPNYKLQYPLHFAAFKKNPEALEYLLECGANPWVLDRKGRTPLEDTSCETCKSLLRAAMEESDAL